MKRVFSNPVVALAAGLCLRLFFILRFPADSGDTVLYEQIAKNWLKYHIYGMDVGGALTPVDLRMPGYPAVLVLIYAITGKTGLQARPWVMFAQIFVDLASCLVIAYLAARLWSPFDKRPQSSKRVFTAALWMSALCPFSANYTAVLMTEVLAIFFTCVALLFLSGMASQIGDSTTFAEKTASDWWKTVWMHGCLGALAIGLGALFRPETPLLLAVVWIVAAGLLLPHGRFGHWVKTIFVTAFACAVPLLPWAIRNAVTLHEVQLLAPKNSNLSSELVPYGFMAWEKTWLFRMKDCYQVSWKLNEEAIEVNDIPTRAFDSAEEKQRVAAILESYNKDLTLTAEEDALFAQLARERTRRHPLRRYVALPVARAATIWLSPRIELLPFSGDVFPLAREWKEDRTDQAVTVGFFTLNFCYLALAIWGAWYLWTSDTSVRPAAMLLIIFIVLRTAFLTTLETPEPRYTLECFPALIAFGAQVFARTERRT